ncbi:MAG: NUDIX hydrolase [Actinomycetales bacterium]
MASDCPPVAPVTAATVLLLRDSETGPEVFLMRRASTMPFAPGMFVFPGGRLDPIDEQPVETIDHQSLISAAQRSNLTVAHLVALMACASREVQEEAGIDVPLEALTLAGRWVTPEFEPRRYDVHFFAAEVGSGQQPFSASSETDEANWYQPATCIEHFYQGRMPMLPPTLAMLTECTHHTCVTDILEHLGSRAVRPHLPRPLSADRTLWCVVDAQTDEVLIARIRRPQVRETDAEPVAPEL